MLVFRKSVSFTIFLVMFGVNKVEILVLNHFGNSFHDFFFFNKATTLSLMLSAALSFISFGFRSPCCSYLALISDVYGHQARQVSR